MLRVTTSFATLRGVLGCPLRRFRRVLCRRSRGPPCPGHLADSRIPRNNELAGAQRRLLEIRRIDRQDLPARHFLPEYLNGSHIRELAAKAFVVLFSGSEPHSVICSLVALVAQDEGNLVLNVDRQAAKHGVGPG